MTVVLCLIRSYMTPTIGCTASGWQLRAALQGRQTKACNAGEWQPMGLHRDGLEAEGCAVLQGWQPRACTTQVAAEGCAVHAAVVAAEGCAMLQCWQLKAVAGVVSAKGLHCNGGSRGAALHRWQPRVALCCSGGC